MTASPSLIDWFRDEPLPGVVPDPAIVLGGTALLREFLAIPTKSPDGGQLSIAAPFVGRGIALHLPVWGLMPHSSIDLIVVTSGTANAGNTWSEIGRFPWRTVALQVRPRLHAKMYSFLTPTGGGACLIGSHNLTRSGAIHNHEAGVLFIASHGEICQVIRSCHERVVWLMRKGETFIDTVRWPADRAA